MDRPRRHNRHHRFAPSMERLEFRQLPSTFGFGSSSSNNQQLVAVVRHQYDKYVGELKTLELKSQATPSEFLALRDDARAISSAVSAANLSSAVANPTAVDVSLQLDRSPLYGSAKDAGWAVVTARVTTNLDTLHVSQPLIDQTLADMKTLAGSAGVTSAEFQTFTNDFYTLRAGEASLPSSPYYHFEDPGLYYTQHLRGFFRHWGMQKVDAEKTLNSNLRTIQSQTHPDPAGVAVIHRDVHLLESLGAAVPSTTNQQLGDAYLAAFTDGAVPTPQAVAQMQSSLVTIMGPVGTPSRVASINRLANDAPAFAQATGLSVSNVQTIVTDVAAVVDAGGGETLNPFKVTISHTS